MEIALRELKLGVDSDQDGSIHYQLARLYGRLGDQRMRPSPSSR